MTRRKKIVLAACGGVALLALVAALWVRHFLTVSLPERSGSVAVRGLGRHQLRLLRYCGLQLPPERREADEESRG